MLAVSLKPGYDPIIAALLVHGAPQRMRAPTIARAAELATDARRAVDHRRPRLLRTERLQHARHPLSYVYQLRAWVPGRGPMPAMAEVDVGADGAPDPDDGIPAR